MTGMGHHPLYSIWRAMKWRCYNPKRRDFQNYGAQGIRVCDRWLTSFDAFVHDMGDRPSALHSIDRINGAGDYEPSNCRWATASEQALNRRPKSNAVRLEHDGRTLLVSEWAEVTGLNKHVIRSRISTLGWPVARALSTPIRMRARAA